jgi:hypothetical protein
VIRPCARVSFELDAPIGKHHVCLIEKFELLNAANKQEKL